MPTWFLAAYVVVCARRAGDPLALGAHRLVVGRRRARCSACLVDLVSIGTDSLAVGFANYLVVWATVHQLGYAWLDGRLAGTRRRLVLAAVGRGRHSWRSCGPAPTRCR